MVCLITILVEFWEVTLASSVMNLVSGAPLYPGDLGS